MTGMGGHESTRNLTDVWLTPKPVIDALGGWESFDLDPCAPAVQPWRTARATFCEAQDGLLQGWAGRIWLNPPYSQAPLRAFMGRMAAHGRGTALIFARTETETFWRFVWERASALLFLKGRLTFHTPDGRPGRGNAGAPSVLCAYGARDADILAFCGLGGAFVPLNLPRGLLIVAAPGTWRQEIAALLGASGTPVRLSDLYRAMAHHPKTRGNPNWQAKIRQQLQEGPFERVGRGLWKARAA